jgi:hypothetical protein
MSVEDTAVWGVPRWVLIPFITVFLAGTTSATGWLWSLQAQNASQDVRLASGEVKIEFVIRDQQLTQNKLDKVMELLEEIRRGK